VPAVRIWAGQWSLSSQLVWKGNRGKTMFSRKMGGTFVMIRVLATLEFFVLR
jgi:hypothetical protein